MSSASTPIKSVANGETAAVVAAPVPNQGSAQGRTWLHPIIDGLDRSNTNVSIPLALARLVGDYFGNGVEFGPEDWRHHYGIYVANEELSEEAFRWWHSLDAITPFDDHGHPNYNWQTHYGFHYMPTTYRTSPESAEEIAMDLEHFDLLGTKPQAGHPSRFNLNRYKLVNLERPALEQNKNQRVAQGYFVAMRKEVLFRKKTTGQQRALLAELNTKTESQMPALQAAHGTLFGLFSCTRYENLPHINHLCMLARNHLTKTGERILGDETGVEKQYTYSRVEQQVTRDDVDHYQVTVGSQSPLAPKESSSSGGLHVNEHHDYDLEYVGIAGLRKFLGLDAKPSVQQLGDES